ncbi:MAG TPA: FAD binding domain-containing protein [Solirubrobacteraceae bacterium]|jgi:CO/xanthine dehydrogenase FAD-binding subunit|nr:FAD binding domain-containing protein [Solirubrobacteraceae bacterium]
MDLNGIGAIVAAAPSSLETWQDGDAWLAGGTWLFSEPQPEIRRLVDLTYFRWPALRESDAGLEIAATCTLGQLSRYEGPADWPAAALARQCCDALLGSFKVWNAATVGGNICLSLPAGPMTSLAAALDGVCTIWTRSGEVREVAICDFVLGPGENVLEPGDLLRSVLLPAAAMRCATAFRQLSLSPVGRSAVIVVGRRRAADGAFVVTVTGSVRRPVKLHFDAPPAAEELGRALEDAALDYHDDVHGDPVWRRHLTRLYVEEVRRELSCDEP